MATNDKTGNSRAKSAMWGGRFEGGPAEAMTRFNSAIEEDKAIAIDDIEGSIAHATMLGATGIITATEAETLVSGLNTVRQEVEAGTFEWDDALEDVHMNVEHRLRTHVGDVAGKLHTGRSRNDQVATDMRLFARRRLDVLLELITDVQRAFLDQGEAHTGTLMPGFTHLQIAQPISYAFYCGAYIEMFERDRQRLKAVRARLNESPLGAAALAGTPHPIDRTQTAEVLGFAHPCRNALDAVSARDFVLDVAAAASICATHISRYAEEVVIYASSQFGYLKIGDQYTTGSSIMPQKRNPDAAELLRAKVGQIAGAFHAATLTTKGVSLAYAKDLQETKRPLIEVFEALEASLDILARMIRETTPVPAPMERDAGAGFATATDLADALAKKGMPFRDAHHVVGALVAHAEKAGVTLDKVPLDDAVTISNQITQKMLDSLSPAASIRTKSSFGSTHPDEVAAFYSAWRERLSQ